MRTDTAIRLDVIAELASDPSVRHEDIAVAVMGGVVTLAGHVDSYAQRYAAGLAVGRVRGVCAVVNDLTIKLPGNLVRTDTEIAHAGVEMLRWHSEVPDDRLRLKVENGWVTIQGELDWHFQKEAAERVIRSLSGVRGMTSLITLKVMPVAADIRERIHSGLKRQAEFDADQITVETTGSRVTLRGSVQSIAERRAAERAVWNAPGVMHVDDEMVIVTPQPLLM